MTKETGATDAASLGRLIRKVREKRKLSLSQVGGSTTMSPSNISEIELGKKLPSLRTLSRLAEALGVRWRITFVPAAKKGGR